MHHLLDPVDNPLAAWLARRGEAAFRVGQIRQWLFARRAETFAEMTDLPQALRDALAADFTIWTSRTIGEQRADDGTVKLLLELADGQTVECVLIREPRRRTICISTQVGCGMGCVFCASGLEGVARNLTAGEIVEQMLRLARTLDADERLSHIVVMGMGEPLANLPALLPALEVATSPHGLGISPRRITISTVGLPPGIDRLAKLGAPYSLAVSLHAPDDALRNQLVRVNARIGIDAILAAADRYFAATGRRLTFEYVLLADINDRPRDAAALVNLLRDRIALLNVIPYNPVAGLPYRRPSEASITRFIEALRQGGIDVQVRKRKGDRIDAACGQLRRQLGAADENATGELARQTPAP